MLNFFITFQLQLEVLTKLVLYNKVETRYYYFVNFEESREILHIHLVIGHHFFKQINIISSIYDIIYDLQLSYDISCFKCYLDESLFFMYIVNCGCSKNYT